MKTKIFTITVKDGDDNPVTPTTMSWTLTDYLDRVLDSGSVDDPTSEEEVIFTTHELIGNSNRNRIKKFIVDITYGAGHSAQCTMMFRAPNNIPECFKKVC